MGESGRGSVQDYTGPTMGWLLPALLGSLLLGSLGQPLDHVEDAVEEQTQMKELLTSMFIDNHRSGREMDEEDEEEVDAVSSSDPQEISRFNNYMDAIYRRMNAALRAKLMDPMVLNMEPKNKKAAEDKKKNKKKRVERAAEEDEEEYEVSVDRIGETEISEAKKHQKLLKKEEKKAKGKKGVKEGDKKKKNKKKSGKGKKREGKPTPAERLKKRIEKRVQKKKEKIEKKKAKR